MIAIAILFLAIALLAGFWALKAKAGVVTGKAATGFYKILFLIFLVLGFLALLHYFLNAYPASS